MANEAIHIGRQEMIRILFLASNPENSSPLKLDEEIRAITYKIRASDYRDALDIRSIWAVRPDDLLQALNEYKPQIVQFSGHGKATGEILLMDNDRQLKPVSVQALKMLFATLKDDIRVVVLNACFSRVQAKAIAEVIDCVIGMNAAIGDDAAITFSASFYRAIGFGRSVKEAFEQGKTALLLEGIPEAEIPHLIVRPGVDPSLIVLTGEGAQEETYKNSLAKIYGQMPENLRALIDSGHKFVDIPLSASSRPLIWQELKPKSPSDYLFFKLKMRQTPAVFVVRVPKVMRIEDAAEYLAKQLLPHMRFEAYEWTLVYKDKMLPPDHTFVTSGIDSGDTVYLLGNHRWPEWLPQMEIY